MKSSGDDSAHTGHKSILQSASNDGAAIADGLKRLSLSRAAATPLPPSSPVPTPHVTPLRRAPSSSSIRTNERSTTPPLTKRTSFSSLKSADGATPPRSPAIRRTSSHFQSNSATGSRSSLPPPAEEPPRLSLTAANVAHEFFKKELGIHHADSGSIQKHKSVVILQDDCYGHRYSRPRTSRANLNTIVERPERIHASVLGLAAAYVRLGGRHANGHSASQLREENSPSSPAPFRIQKTTRKLPLRSPAVTAIHGAQWMAELAAMCDSAESKLALGGKELTRPHLSGLAKAADDSKEPRLHEGDLYLCSGSLDALEGALGGVCEGVDAVFKDQGPRRAFVCIRPPGHHCSSNMPSGFCWLNNVHVGIGHAVLKHGLTHAAILDFDLHHGDGSQSITWAHNSRISSMARNTPISKRTAIGYFSLHDINSYPCEMGDEEKVRNASLCIENAHGQSIWNVHLQPWKTEAQFWELYEHKYSVILAKAKNFLRLHSEKLRQAPTHPKPRAAIFLSAGFDASEWESPGMQRHQVNVPTEFYARLTRDVVVMAEEEDLGVEGRVISVLEGGYSDRALMSGVLSHMSGLTSKTDSTEVRAHSSNLVQEAGSPLEKLAVNNKSAQGLVNGNKEQSQAYDPDWWSLPSIEEVEALINPPTLTLVPKKQRSDARPTYTSATKSYTAKIVSPSSGRRSISGPISNAQQSPKARPPSPPPAVDWATAAHELSKLLIPSNRETRSCKPEDLNAEATRARRNRYSTVGLTAESEEPIVDAKRMQLRDRRGKTPQYASEEEDPKPSTRANRRKTMAGVPLLAEAGEPPIVQSVQPGPRNPVKHNRRSSSIASSTSSVIMERGSDTSSGPVKDYSKEESQGPTNKSRASHISRPEPTKTKFNTKPAPASRFPSNPSNAPIPENDEMPPRENVLDPLLINEASKNKDLDQLASGMRKMSIKLNVPPREAYIAKESIVKTAPKRRPAKPAAAKATKTTSPVKPKGRNTKVSSPTKSQPAEHAIVHQPTVSQMHEIPTASVQMAPSDPSQVPSQPAGPEAPAETSLLHGNSQIQPLAADNAHDDPASISQSTGFDPNQVRIPEATLQSHPNPDIDTNGSAQPSTLVTAKRTKQDLPIFTSTSSITFGGQTMDYNQNDQTMDTQVKPESLPAHFDDRSRQHISEEKLQNETTYEGKTLPVQRSSAIPPKAEENTKLVESQSSASIWDVPDTPFKA